jgi:hypothetical protein
VVGIIDALCERIIQKLADRDIRGVSETGNSK